MTSSTTSYISPIYNSLPCSGISNASVVLIASTSTIVAMRTSLNPSNTPPLFGSSRTYMVNATANSQCESILATGCHMATGTMATQTSSGSGFSTHHSSAVVGSGTRSNFAWSHVFIWAVVTDILYFWAPYIS
jgi:hypothetical protein